MSTITLPRRIVVIACHQFIPCDIKPDASVYVVITTLMPIQSAAMLYVDHVRRLSGVGARSGFQSLLCERSSSTVTKSTVYEDTSIPSVTLTRVLRRDRPWFAAATARVLPCPPP